MKRGSLKTHFIGVAVKQLSAVEVNPNKSNQHELNGVQDLKNILGESRQAQIPARFIYLGSEEDEIASAEGFVTWYDARDKHPERSEYRLYFAPNAVMESAEEGDQIFVCRRPDLSMLFVVTKQGSTAANQVGWLFSVSVPPTRSGLKILDTPPLDETRAGVIGNTILEQLGIETESAGGEDLLATLLQKFGSTFPTTKKFSSFARETAEGVSPIEDPDLALMCWMNHEELLFRTLERHIVSKRLETGFGTDVDSFIEFSLGVQNRRKSRMGHALENHLAQLFSDNGVAYSKNQITEANSKPDFIFPGISQYRDLNFSSGRLSMLGVKSTCKDRWRQVLAEADRVAAKHLFTLEPGISENQTSEMETRSLRLVLPAMLHSSYNVTQRSWLMNLSEFVEYVQDAAKFG